MKKIFAFLFFLNLSCFAQKDTLKYKIMLNNQKIGFSWLFRPAQTDFRSFMQTSDGTKIYAKYRLNADQIMTELDISGKDKNVISEKFKLENGTARWVINGVLKEVKAVSALYLPQTETMDNVLTRALLTSPTKKVFVLPAAVEASTFIAYELTLRNKQKAFLFQINGLNVKPTFDWVDENSYSFGKFTDEKIIIREGYEEYISEFVRLQKMSEIKALKEIAKQTTAKNPSQMPAKITKIVAKKKVIHKKS